MYCSYINGTCYQNGQCGSCLYYPHESGGSTNYFQYYTPQQQHTINGMTPGEYDISNKLGRIENLLEKLVEKLVTKPAENEEKLRKAFKEIFDGISEGARGSGKND
jgi:hypothetical protein